MALTHAHDFDTAFLHSLAVEEADIDFMGHVNNLVYLRWAAEMAERHWQSIAPADAQAAGLWVVLRHEIDYRGELKLGDAVELRTWVGPAKGARCPRWVDIRKPDAAKPSASVLTQWAFIDAASRRPRRMPKEVAALFGM